MKSLLDDIIDFGQELREVTFVLNKKHITHYYTLMTGLEREKIVELSTKTKTLNDNGNKVEIRYIDDDLMRCYTILYMAKDKDGKKMYTLGDVHKIQNKMPYKYQALLSSAMTGLDLEELIADAGEQLKKTQS